MTHKPVSLKASNIFDSTGWMKPEAFSTIRAEHIGAGQFPPRVYNVKTCITQRQGWNSLMVENGVFICCGTSSIEQLHGIWTSDSIQWQEALSMILRGMLYWEPKEGFLRVPDLLMCVTESQFENKWGDCDLPKWFMDHGAVDMGIFPNNVHGPENLHLIRWNPRNCAEKLNDWVYWNTESTFIPLYMKGVWEDEQRQAREAMAQQKAKAGERGSLGAVGASDVRPALRAGVPKLDPAPVVPQPIDQGGFAPFLGGNAYLKGIQNYVVEDLGVRKDG